jgi:hypothetical protein
VNWDSVDGIATRYWLESPGIEFRWGEPGFLHPIQPYIKWVPGFISGVK